MFNGLLYRVNGKKQMEKIEKIRKYVVWDLWDLFVGRVRVTLRWGRLAASENSLALDSFV